MSLQTPIDLTDVDLFVRGDHTEAFRTLRAEAPIYWNDGADGSQFWALSTYEDVQWAYRNHEVFGSARGAIVGGSLRSDEDTSAGQMLVSTDLPRHRMLKQAIHPAMSATVAKRVAGQVSELVEQAIAKTRADGGCDFATLIATELPAGALMVIMGIGHEDAHHLIGLTRRMVGYRDEIFVDTGGDARLRLAWLQAEVFEFFADIVTERRRNPGDDLVSILVQAEVNGRKLTEEEIFYNCMNVAVGGNETSSYTACTGLLALMENPEQYRLLHDSPQLLGTAVEEMLRWSSTNAYVQRVATRDITRGGIEIKSGESVTLWNYSANRDESKFPDSHRFDIARNPNRHLSYGAGLHRCIGAPIAQAELSLLFELLISSGLTFKLSGEVRRLRSNFILGVTRLPVEVA
ncbi:cytochrome P450 [Kitasatospora atroaurantiaca]|uniref:Cytochrome P450 n=1 Tax=Kitasatospora atroaurantiaca TaxID=285545 RepID=A0A561ERG4_9ACTN|nr:cytochrome P450 [Kitasatospora atroaurantiaca]TWE18200.1 cytochrome P450 [Kitasatospora atroaurantiaca]